MDIQFLRDKAKAAIEARASGDFKAIRAYEDAATPERILQYGDEVLEDAIGVVTEAFWNNQRREDIVKILRSLKSKEPSP